MNYIEMITTILGACDYKNIHVDGDAIIATNVEGNGRVFNYSTTEREGKTWIDVFAVSVDEIVGTLESLDFMDDVEYTIEVIIDGNPVVFKVHDSKMTN